MRKLKLYSKFAALVLSECLILNGCNSKNETGCELNFDHAHRYVNEETGLSLYAKSEISHYSANSVSSHSSFSNKLAFDWTEDYTTDEKYLEDSEVSQRRMLIIKDNVEALIEDEKNNIPYLEYEYEDTRHYWVKNVPLSSKRKRFTTDSNHKNLTGRIRDVSYQYVGHGFIEDENGKLQFEENVVETVEELIENSDKYPYIYINSYKEKKYSNTYEPSKKITK